MIGVHLVGIAGLSVATWLAMRAARDAGPVRAVDPDLRTAVHALALGGPWLLYFEGHVPGSNPTVPLAISWALYTVAVWLVGAAGDRCARARPADG